MFEDTCVLVSGGFPTCTLLIISAAIISIALTVKYLNFISMDEQLIIDGLTTQTVVNGPKTIFINPFMTKKFQIQKALSLGQSEYCVIKNILTGEKYVQVGPKLVWLKPYDNVKKDAVGREKRAALSLKANEYVRFIDNETGKVRVIKGEKGCVVPRPNEEFLDIIVRF